MGMTHSIPFLDQKYNRCALSIGYVRLLFVIYVSIVSLIGWALPRGAKTTRTTELLGTRLYGVDGFVCLAIADRVKAMGRAAELVEPVPIE